MRNYIQNFLGNNLILFLSIWIMASKTPKRDRFPLRFAASFILFNLWRYWYFEILTPSFGSGLNVGVNILGFLQMFTITVLAACFCYDCDFWAALFVGGASYNIQHVYERMYNILSNTLLENAQLWVYILTYTVLIALCAGTAWLIVRKLKIDTIEVNNHLLLLVNLAMISTAVVLDLLFFAAFDMGRDVLLLCTWVSSLMMGVLLFGLQINLITGRRSQIELAAIKQMLEEDREQYYFEKSMIDMVNIKCHDLKHQIAMLDGAGKKQLTREIREDIDGYDSTFHTGKVALDVVLTKKNFACKEKNLTMTCTANGGSLEFMSDVDVYSLFGNILDNAIEATEKLEDESKRLIILSVTRNGYFVSIHEENYYSNNLVFAEGLPETTKSDTVYHGFGLKSIRMLVQKYDGSLKVGTYQGRFVLDIMFPL